MNFDDLRSFFWFCPVFRILLNCPFFEKRKNRSYPTIDHFFPLLSPPPHGTIQRGFLWAYSRDSKGNDDKSLIPDALLSWYESEPSSDEICTEELNIDPEEVHTDEE